MSASAITELRAAFEDAVLRRSAATRRAIAATVLISWPSVPVELVRAAGFRAGRCARQRQRRRRRRTACSKPDLFPEPAPAARRGRADRAAWPTSRPSCCRAAPIPTTSAFSICASSCAAASRARLPPVLLFDLLHSDGAGRARVQRRPRARLVSRGSRASAGRPHRADDLRDAIASANRARAAARRLNALRGGSTAHRRRGRVAVARRVLAARARALCRARECGRGRARRTSRRSKRPRVLARRRARRFGRPACRDRSRGRRRRRGAEPVRQRAARAPTSRSRTTRSLRSQITIAASRSTRALPVEALMHKLDDLLARRRSRRPLAAARRRELRLGLPAHARAARTALRFRTPCSPATRRSCATAADRERIRPCSARAPRRGRPAVADKQLQSTLPRRHSRNNGSAICAGACSTSAGRTRSSRPTCRSSSSICSRSPPSAISGGRRWSPRSAKRRLFSPRWRPTDCRAAVPLLQPRARDDALRQRRRSAVGRLADAAPALRASDVRLHSPRVLALGRGIRRRALRDRASGRERAAAALVGADAGIAGASSSSRIG